MCHYGVIATHMFRRTLDHPVPHSYLQRGSSPSPARKPKAGVETPEQTKIDTDLLQLPTRSKRATNICKACELAIHGESIWEDDISENET